MPQYAYRAKDSALKLVEGTIEAESESAAISRLGNQGIFPLSITEVVGAVRQAAPAAVPSGRVPSSALALTTRQLADLLSGGIPLLNALMLLAKQTEHRHLRQVVESVSDDVRDGQSLSASFSRHPEVFSSLYINMVKAGEVGGGLEEVLSRLADLGEAENELKSRVISALVYPSVVLVIGCLAVVVLLIYVIPKVAVLFTEGGQLLPLPTRMLLALSDFLRHGWWALVIGLVLAGWILRRLWRSPVQRQILDRLILRVPLCGTLVRKLDVARFTRSLGVMIGQGVPVLQAFEVVSRNVSNVVLQRALRQVQEAVRDGSSVAAALTASGQFPAFVSNMVAVGEESGTVDAALLKVATAYEREVDRAMRALTTVLEPLLLVVVGLVVMFIVISMLLPIFQIGLVSG